jgi:predicted kinase
MTLKRTNVSPRLRMFAGPNGSGKSTMKSVLKPQLLGVYVNPDDIERELHLEGCLNLRSYGENIELKVRSVPLCSMVNNF